MSSVDMRASRGSRFSSCLRSIEPGHAVERDAAVVADDPAAAVGVGQAGQDVRAAAAPDVGGVGVEDAVVVGLAVLRERLDHVRVGLVAVGLQSVDHHAGSRRSA